MRSLSQALETTCEDSTDCNLELVLDRDIMQDLYKHCDFGMLKANLISGTHMSKHNDFLLHCMKGINSYVFIGKRSKSGHIATENVNSLSFSTCPYQVLQFGYISVISIFP